MTADAFTIEGFAAGTIINIICEGECWIIGRAGAGGLRNHGQGTVAGYGGVGTRGIYISGDYEINFTGTFFVWAGGGGGGAGAARSHDNNDGRSNGGTAGGFRLGQIFLPGGGGGGGGAGGTGGGAFGYGKPNGLNGYLGDRFGGSSDGGGSGSDASVFTARRSGAGGGGGASGGFGSGASATDAVGATPGTGGPGAPHDTGGNGGGVALHFVNRNGLATINRSDASIKVGAFDVVISTSA